MLELEIDESLLCYINISKWGTILNYSYIAKDSANGILGKIIDILAVVATIAGVATSLGLGALPFSIIMLFIMLSVIKALKSENK